MLNKPSCHWHAPDESCEGEVRRYRYLGMPFLLCDSAAEAWRKLEGPGALKEMR